MIVFPHRTACIHSPGEYDTRSDGKMFHLLLDRHGRLAGSNNTVNRLDVKVDAEDFLLASVDTLDGTTA